MKPVQSYYEALHQIPECSGQERETAAYVFERLCSAGYSPRRYACGGVLYCGIGVRMGADGEWIYRDAPALDDYGPLNKPAAAAASRDVTLPTP